LFLKQKHISVTLDLTPLRLYVSSREKSEAAMATIQLLHPFTLTREQRVRAAAYLRQLADDYSYEARRLRRVGGVILATEAERHARECWVLAEGLDK